MLKTILIVTLMVLDPFGAADAYRDELNYQVIERGRVDPALAAGWGAPAVAGRDYALLQAASAEPVFLRFIDAAGAQPPAMMRSSGWNAVEILATDPEALAAQLAGSSAFRILDPPRWLTPKENIKAMQVQGPSGELLYFTQIRSAGSSGFGLQPGRTFVDRVFIMVVGGGELDALRRFYAATFNMPVSDPLMYRIGVLSRAWGLPEETLHQLALVKLSDRFLIELDQYPAGLVRRPVAAGDLPPGIAMVSFEVPALPADPWRLRATPRAVGGYPYSGRRTGVLTGPAGEFIELIETPARFSRGAAAETMP